MSTISNPDEQSQSPAGWSDGERLADREPESNPSAASLPLSPAPRRWRRWGLAGVVVLLLFAGGVGWLYWASQRVPDFYEAASRQVDSVPPEEVRKAAARVTRQTQAVLERERAEENTWTFDITPIELNAWLIEVLPGLVQGEWPEELDDLRIAFEKERIRLGVKVSSAPWTGVVSFSLRPMLKAPRTILLEIESLKMGDVPLPVERLVSEVPELARSPFLRRDSRSGRYVVRVPLDSKETRGLRLDTLDLTPERLRLSGR